MFKKFATATVLANNIKSLNELEQDDSAFIEYFKKTAANLKAIAPKANDFLYFTCIMMHAAEAALIDDSGNLRKTADGKDVEAHWEETKNGGLIWKCSDPNINVYKNKNSDTFPEKELKLAHKAWIGKPLCLDHQSQSVDHIRGVIVDTVYDDKFKRIIALCALDKVNYPDLARKVQTGYSTSVSMGVAVAQAICSECATAARTEAEFCNHMRYKTGYAEINVGLSPIELSIVVSPADPKANIRRIIASAGSVAQYVEENSSIDPSVLMLKNQLQEKIAQLQEQLDKISGDNVVLEDREDILPPYGQPGRGTLNMAETSLDNTADGIQAASTARYASVEDLVKDLKDNISQLDNAINKTAYTKEGEKTINKDNEMGNDKRAYYQGGGGVNEPTPGQVKYPKEEADKIRDTQDKQMAAIENTGPVDGLWPGDEALKKQIQRAAAEKEDRRIRREAALTRAKEALEQRKEAYYQGGGGVNEPTPGKPKYPKEDAEKIREKEDKQMVGEKPFPGVGPIDGLYPGDLETKKQIQRAAKLSARFVKASKSDGSDDHANSRWDIYAKTDGKSRVVLSATVEELAGKEKVASLYPLIATEHYAKEILSTIRTAGLDEAAKIYKQAQDVPAAVAPGGVPGAAVDAGGISPGLPVEPAAEYAGEAGDPAEQIANQVNELSNLSAELQKTVETLQEDKGEAPAVGGEDLLPKAAATIKAGLIKGATQILGKVTDSLEECQLLNTLYREAGVTDASRGWVNNLVKDALASAKTVKDEATELKASFVRYAKAKDSIMKKAQAQLGAADLNPNLIEIPESAAPMLRTMLGEGTFHAKYRVVSDEQFKKNQGIKPGIDMGYADDCSSSSSSMKADDCSTSSTTSAKANDCGYLDSSSSTSSNSSDKNKVNTTSGSSTGSSSSKSTLKTDPYLKPVIPGGGPVVEDPTGALDKPLFNLNDIGNIAADFDPATGKVTMDIKNASRADRDSYRLKLAQKGLQFSEMLQKSNPSGVTVSNINKPQDDLAKIETVKEQHEKMMGIATAPPKVKEAADNIQALVIKGEINPATDFPGLIANGVDAAAVAYWKSYYGEAKDKDSSNFGADLVKEYASKKKAEAEEQSKVKIARAFETAHELAQRGVIGSDTHSIRAQADQLMNFSDHDFEYFRSTLVKIPVVKQASLPMVGMTGLPEIPSQVKTATAETHQNLTQQFESILMQNTKRRNF